MLLFKPFLLSLISILYIKAARGDGTTDDACLNEMAAYQACAINSQYCDSGCESVNQDPEFTEEEILAMITDPNFMCKWFNELFCEIQNCCDACNNEANAYFSCLAKESTEDGTCEFTCTNNNGGTVDNGGDTAVDSNGNGGTVDQSPLDDGNEVVDEAGTDNDSSARNSMSAMSVWIGGVVIVVYGLI